MSKSGLTPYDLAMIKVVVSAEGLIEDWKQSSKEHKTKLLKDLKKQVDAFHQQQKALNKSLGL